ncbi:MAG: hypothetical protein OEM02_06100, partial [Desulfobulbaceae bacterium]|nr:hypothetical protein [Desulfobulbaceae bacterium]
MPTNIDNTPETKEHNAPLACPPNDNRRSHLFYSMRSRLQALTLFITILPLIVATLGTMVVLKKHLNHDISTQLQRDTQTAALYYQNEVNKISATINAISLDNTIGIALKSSVYYPITTHLALLSVQHNLDFLIIVDKNGRCLTGPFFQAIEGKLFSDHPIIIQALTTHQTFAATHLENNQDLLDFFQHTGKKVYNQQNI